MVEIGKTDNILKKVFLILMLTVIPLAIVIRLWFVIVTYWILILAFLLIGLGGIFLYCYVKSLSLRKMALMLFDFLHISKTEEDESEKSTQNVVMQKNKAMLNTGVFTLLVGLYLFIKRGIRVDDYFLKIAKARWQIVTACQRNNNDN